MQSPVTISFAPLKVVAVIRRCAKCGGVVARTIRAGKLGQITPHTCTPPPAAAMALAA